jgi:hypothetical protein
MSIVNFIIFGLQWVFVLAFGHIFYLFAFLMARALSETWRPIWQCIAYCLLLGLTDQGFKAFFFAPEPSSGTISLRTFMLDYAIDTAVLIGITLVTYRITRAQKMVAQYPWLYRRAGLLSWREIPRINNTL